MKKEIKLKMKGRYTGHNVKSNGVVNLNFAFEYTELVSIVPLIQLLNNNVEMVARIEKKITPLGNFMLNQIKVNGDGSSAVRFNGIVESIEVDNLNKLMIENLQIMVKSTIEIEEGD